MALTVSSSPQLTTTVTCLLIAFLTDGWKASVLFFSRHESFDVARVPFKNAGGKTGHELLDGILVHEGPEIEST